MVPADWQHPKDERGRYIPLLDQSHAEAVREWEEEELTEWVEGARLWATGFVKTFKRVKTIEQVVEETKANRPYAPPPEPPTYEWWAGDVPRKPEPTHYMPDWPESERTHFMMYEDTSEGTPISPAFATAEELARWLADTGASAFAGYTATYDQWLATIRRGSAISVVMENGVLKSGVEAMA